MNVESRSKEGHSNTRDTVTSAVRMALDITELLSEGVPFLPGAVQAPKTVVDTYEVRRSRSNASLWPFVELRHLTYYAMYVDEHRVRLVRGATTGPTTTREFPGGVPRKSDAHTRSKVRRNMPRTVHCPLLTARDTACILKIRRRPLKRRRPPPGDATS